MGINASNANRIQSSFIEPSLQPIGRFAPSPTGELHLGSVTTAVASYCHIKSMHGKWLLRIEDTDFQRCKPEFSQLILQDLSALNLFWDDEIVYQSNRSNIYNSYINDILRPHVYACECSRKQLKMHAIDNLETIYPKNCVDKSLDLNQHKLRIQLPNQLLSFNDGIQGFQYQNPQTTLGDMVIRRGNIANSSHNSNSHNMINYILAVSIDDGLQNVSHVMRGLDILPLTSAQIAIMHMAGFQQTDFNKKIKSKKNELNELTTQNQPPTLSANSSIPTILNDSSIPNWYHLPLIQNEHGQKLSKQNLATPIDTSTEKKCSQLIATALEFLQQPKVDMDTPQRMLNQAVQQWRNELIQ